MVVENLDIAHPDQAADANQVFWHEERVCRGDTISDLLERLGVNDDDARAFLRQSSPGASLHLLRPGTTVQARTAEDGSLLALRYITDKGRLSASTNRARYSRRSSSSYRSRRGRR